MLHNYSIFRNWGTRYGITGMELHDLGQLYMPIIWIQKRDLGELVSTPDCT